MTPSKDQDERRYRSSAQVQIPTGKGLKELEGVQHRLDELEQIVLCHPSANSVVREEEDDNEDVETIVERPARIVQYRTPSEPMGQLVMKRAFVIG